MGRTRILVMGAICLAMGMGYAQAGMLLVNASTNQSASTWLFAATGGANYDLDEFEANTALGLTIEGRGNQYNTTFWGSPPPTYDLWAKIYSVDGTLIPADGYRMLADFRYYSVGDPATAGNVIITNLKAGTYDLTVFGVKGDTSTNTFTFYANGSLFGTTQNVPYNNPSSLTAAQIVDSITATGSITILNTGTYANKLVIRSGDWDQPLNGFYLTPEPATLVLLALGGLMVLRRRA
jgi:hypothetical protein